jgi:GT2 family glycosyltransferase
MSSTSQGPKLKGASCVKELFFVSCTRGRKEETALYRSLRKLGTDRYWFFENNREGLPARYNLVLDERAGRDEIVVCVHDDVVIGDLFIAEKLNDAVDRLGCAVVGVAGSPNFAINLSSPVTMWMCPPLEQLSGAVEYAMPDNTNVWNVFGATPRPCVVLDGMFLALAASKIGKLRFDEQFNFHFYDLDFCLTAHSAGLVLGTTNIYTSHSSPGGYSGQPFLEAQAKFRSKWSKSQAGDFAGAPQS